MPDLRHYRAVAPSGLAGTRPLSDDSDVTSRVPPQRTIGTVRQWSSAAGEGVLDSAQTPGGCWAEASAVDGGSALRAGQVVHLEFEARQRAGFDYVATRIRTDDALETAGG